MLPFAILSESHIKKRNGRGFLQVFQTVASRVKA